MKATIAAETLLDGEAGALTRKAIELALAGDTVALRLCLERILPVRRGRPVALSLPPIRTAADLTTATAALVDAVGSGELTPDEGQAVAVILEQHRRAMETVELERRIAALEEVTDGKTH